MPGRIFFSFQAKVLTMIAVAMITLMAGMIAVVTSEVSSHLERDVTQNLLTSEAVFRNIQRARVKNLLLRFGNVPNEPRFKATSQLGEPATMRFLLKELAKEYQADAIIYTTLENTTLASVTGHPDANVTDFEVAARNITERARAGTTVYSTDHIGNHIYDLIGAPVVISGQAVGVLVFAVECGDNLAKEFHQLTQCDVIFLADRRITASTYPQRDLDEITIQKFADILTTAGTLEQAVSDTVNKLTIDQNHIMCVAGRFKSAPQQNILGYLLVSSYEDDLAALRQTRRSLLQVGLCAVAVAMLLAWLLVRRVTQPLRQLRDITLAVGTGDFTRQAIVKSNDECGQLADAFNTMTGNLATARRDLENSVETLRSTRDRLTHSEKLSAVGEFVAGVTHELNNPLTSVIGFAELLQQNATDDRQRRQLDIIAREAHRCHKIVQGLLSFSRQHKLERRPVNLNEVIDASVELLAYQLRTSNIEVERRLTPRLPAVMADRHQLQQVFINLLNNARQAIEETHRHGRIRIISEVDGRTVKIRIQDDGPGISKENLAKIFDPFFTTKEVGKGTGLGLSLCYGILESHGGQITVESEPGHGATFLLTLPGATDMEDTAPLRAAKPKTELMGAGKRVLIIDDEPGILALTRDVLTEEHFQVETAPDGETGLKKARSGHFDVILCDWKMPGITGGQVYERLRETHPPMAARMVFMTGDVISETTRSFLDANDRACIAKPFAIDEFQNVIAGMLFDQQR